MDYFPITETKTLELVNFCAQQSMHRMHLENLDIRVRAFEYAFDSMMLRLECMIYAGEKRSCHKTVEFKRPATWVDALQIHAESKGFMCGGGIVSLLLYWCFLGRKPRYVTETKEVEFWARELFPGVRADRRPQCVIAEWLPGGDWSR